MPRTVRLAAIGDCCADIYKNGIVLGGTAYNVAMAARKAGASVNIVSAIGSDDIGRQFLKSFKKNKIDTSHLLIVPGKTDSIQIRLNKRGKPLYSNWKTAAISTVHVSDFDNVFFQKHDAVRAVMFTLTERLFREFCGLDLGDSVKVGDFAGTSADSIDVTGIEQYAGKLDVIIKSVEGSTTQSIEILRSIAKRHTCMVLALLGSKGSIVFTKNDTYHEPARKIRAKNTTGAGDVYQAHFLVSYLQTKHIPTAMRKATLAAANAIS